MKVMIKKLLYAVSLCLVAIVIIISLTNIAYAATDADDPMQDYDKYLDIYICVDDTSGINSDELKAMMAEEINRVNWPFGRVWPYRYRLIVESTDDSIGAIAHANYLFSKNNNQRYFIDLRGADKAQTTLGEEDWQAMARMRAMNIFYVTNVKNPFLNDGGVSTKNAPCGSNGVTVSGGADISALTNSIVAYLKKDIDYKTVSGSTPLEKPMSAFALYTTYYPKDDDDETSSTVGVATFVRDFVGDSGLRIHPVSYAAPSTGAEIEIYTFKITSPSGDVRTLPTRSASNFNDSLMKLTKETELGTWEVDLVVVDSASQVSSTSTCTFLVAGPSLFHINIIPGAHSYISSGSATQTVLQGNEMDEVIVSCDEGYTLGHFFFTAPANLRYYPIFETNSQSITGEPNSSIDFDLPQARLISEIECTLGDGSQARQDKDKYYITLNPTDPDFEYMFFGWSPVVGSFGDENEYVTGNGGELVFGPLPYDVAIYNIVARTPNYYGSGIIWNFYLNEGGVVEDPDEDQDTDSTMDDVPNTADSMNGGLLEFLAALSLLGTATVVFRRKTRSVDR